MKIFVRPKGNTSDSSERQVPRLRGGALGWKFKGLVKAWRTYRGDPRPGCGVQPLKGVPRDWVGKRGRGVPKWF